MKILAVDTSTSFASIAIAVNEQIVAEFLFSTERTLSARLMPEIERILEVSGLSCADIDLFAASIGPGSFTGIRGGVATIQGLAMATAKPCVGFSSLAMLAMNISCSPTLVCSMLDARKNEVYAALYDCTSSIPSSRINDCVLPPATLLDQICTMTGEKIIFIGEGAVRYQNLITERLGDQAIFAPFPLNSPHSANGILLASHSFKKGDVLEPCQLLPVYLRASDAELTKKKASAGHV